jgi:hypothetical protein
MITLQSQAHVRVVATALATLIATERTNRESK